MAAEDIKQLRVARGSVGVVGLPELLEEARLRRFSSDDELTAFLLRGTKAKNFVAPGAESEYAEALFREYKKFVGEPLPEEPAAGLEVKILGPGCPRCRGLEQATMAALAELKIAADLQHVTNVAEIARYRVFATPALVINGKVVSSGRVLSKEQVKKLVSDALAR